MRRDTHEGLDAALLGVLMVLLIVSMQRVAEHPHRALGDLAAGAVLCSVFCGQLMFALGLLNRRRSLAGRVPQAFMAAVLGGLGLPVLLNQLPAQDHHSYSEPLEVDGQRCRSDGATPYLRVRPLKPWADSAKVQVTRAECNRFSRGDVVRFEYAAGALHAPWRRGTSLTGEEGFHQLTARAWAAAQAKEWRTCILANEAAIELRPTGDGGRLFTNLGWCVAEQGDVEQGLQTMHEGCELGWTKGCDWLSKHEASYRRTHRR